MKRPLLILLPFIALSISGIGCASRAVEREVDDLIAKEPATAVGEKPMLSSIQNSKHLTTDQKNKLSALIKGADEKLVQMRQEQAKVIAVWNAALIADEYDADKVAVLESRLARYQSARTELMRSTLSEAKKIVGHSNNLANNSDVKNIYRYVIDRGL